MTDSGKAVFLSYASQDAPVARRICDALRAAGLEVWFDQRELRGGDAWDASIRLQIKECALFIALISSNTNVRSEGYFRLEWKLAVDRSHLMADDQTFLLPVVIDEISESSARVPDRFRERQWLRLLPSEAPAALVERVRQALLADPARLSRDSPSTARPVETLAVTTPRNAIGSTVTAGKRWLVVATAAAILMAGGSAILWTLHRKSSEALEVHSVSNPLSLAILPLRNATGDPKLSYIADGLTASLSSTVTSNLALNEDAFVTPPSVSAAYAGKADPVKWLAKEFGVHFVLQGNVQRAGGKIRLSAELIDAVKGTTVWSESYDGDQSDLLALQDKVKRSEIFENYMYIAAARNIEARASKQTATDYYIRGYALEFEKQSAETKRQELGLFRQMLALEPNSPKAMVCVASALTDLAAASYKEELDQKTREREFEEGRELILKASALGSRHQWVYEVQALYARYHDDQSAWLENSKAWHQSDPNDLVPLLYVANASLYGGDRQNALTLVRQAIDMDRNPPSWGELPLLGKIYFLQNDDARAVEALQQARAVSPSDGAVYAYLAMANSSKGDEAAARAAVAELRNQQPQYTFEAFARLEGPMATTTPAYKTWWETRVIPAWRHAGLPK